MPDLDLVDEELRDLAASVIRRDDPQPFGLYAFAPDDPAAELGRHLERRVFLEAFGNGPELLAQEYGPYESASVFLCVIDHRRALPAGALRLIADSTAGFKSLDDIEACWAEPAAALLERAGVALDPARTLDIATLAVGAGYRKAAADSLVSTTLCQGVTLLAAHAALVTGVAILDVRVLRLLQWQLRQLFRPYPGVSARSYLDSPLSLPVWCDFPSWRARLRETDPTAHDLFIEGRGLEAAVSLPSWTDVRALLPARLGEPQVGTLLPVT